VFEDLVREGARVHASASKAADQAVRSVITTAQAAIQGRVSDVREKATDTLEGLEKMFQTRVQHALQQIGVPNSREIEKLSARVDVLNANIEKLARKRAAPVRLSGDGRRSARHAAHARP
jgi:poly(hydroxyalkanoate) granule-associated protein